mgnify:CR=1 FL=1
MAAIEGYKVDLVKRFKAKRQLGMADRRRARATRPRATQHAVDFVSISMVRNEQDIIEPFIRHHAKMMSLMFVLDNRSTDQTRTILRNLAQELGNVIVTDCPDDGYNQARIMTSALQSVQSAVHADFVFFLDADEFLPVPDQATLRQAVESVPRGGVALLPWKTHLPDPALDETAEPEPLARMGWVRRQENPVYYKAVLRAAGGIDPELHIAQGNHLLLDHRQKALPSVRLTDLPLLHFPLRSTEQLAAKGLISWQANLNRTAGEAGAGDAYQWKRLHDIVQDGKRPSVADLADEALRYAQTSQPAAFAEAALPAGHGIPMLRKHSDGTYGKAERLLDDAKSFRHDVFPVPTRPQVGESRTDIANAFDHAWHWEMFFLDVPPLRWIIEHRRPRSIIDLGCGSGIYPRLYQHLGVADVLGVDGLDLSATVLDENTYRKADLQQPFDAGRRFDLVICLEVLEHLFPETGDILLDSIAAHATDTILFSMAEPGQPGNGHINCMTMDTVLGHWEKRGWFPDLAPTLGMRALSTMSWFRRNIVVLRKQRDTRHADAAEKLRQIGSLDYKWYGQEPGMRSFAFQELLADTRHGYGILNP